MEDTNFSIKCNSCQAEVNDNELWTKDGNIDLFVLDNIFMFTCIKCGATYGEKLSKDKLDKIREHKYNKTIKGGNVVRLSFNDM